MASDSEENGNTLATAKLYVAIKEGDIRKFGRIVEKNNFKEKMRKDEFFFSGEFLPLGVAAMFNRLGFVDLMVRNYGVPFDSKDKQGYTAHDYAKAYDPPNSDMLYFFEEREE